MLVSACGGGGSKEPASAPADPSLQTGTIQGTAATGTALAGATVVVKDDLGKTFTASNTSDAQGQYRVNLNGAKAPYLVQVTATTSAGTVHLYAVATAEDLNRTINVNQLTNLLVANLAEGNPDTFFGQGNFSALTRTRVDQAIAALQAKLSPVLSAANLRAEAVLRTTFVPDHTGIDLLLDVLEVQMDLPNGLATIVNHVDGSRVQDLLNPGSSDDSAQLALPSTEIWGALFNTDGQVASRAQQAQRLISQINADLRQARTSQGLSTLAQWCDASDFLDSRHANCQEWAEHMATLTHRGDNPLLLKQVVAFDVQEVDNTQADRTQQHQISDTDFGVIIGIRNDPRLRENPAMLLSGTPGHWRVAGDRRLVNVSARAYVSLEIGRNTYPAHTLRRALNTGVMVMASTPDDQRATLVHVEGGNWTNDMPLGTYPTIMNANLPSAEQMAAGTVVYAVQVIKDNVEIARYKTRLLSSRVVLPQDIEQETFPTITGPIGEAACAAGRAASTWTLPAGQVPVDVSYACEQVASNQTTGIGEQSLVGLDRPLAATITLSHSVQQADRSEVLLRTLGSDGLLYRIDQSFEVAARGLNLLANQLGYAQSSYGAIEQAWLDNYYNVYFPSAEIKPMSDDGLLSAVCRTSGVNQGYLAYVNTAPLADIRAIEDPAALKGTRFSARQCQGDTSAFALRFADDGASTLTSTSLGANGTVLATNSFSATATANLLSDQGVTANGATTWLHAFEAWWNGVRSVFIIEATKRGSQPILTTIWRALTS